MEQPVQQIDEFDPTDAAAYRCWRQDTVRFNDLDPLWHMNGTSYMVMFETCRILFVKQAGEAAGHHMESWMLVSATINHLAQVRFADTVRIGTRLQRLGRSSVTTMQGMFQSDACVATLESKLVLVDRSVDRSTPMPEDLKHYLRVLSDTGKAG